MEKKKEQATTFMDAMQKKIRAPFAEPVLQVVELEVVDTLTASPEETDGYDWGKIVG